MGEKGSTPNTGDRAAVISNKSQSRRRLSLATIRDYWPWAAVLVLSIPLWYMFFKVGLAERDIKLAVELCYNQSCLWSVEWNW